MEVSGQLHAPAALTPGYNLVTHFIGRKLKGKVVPVFNYVPRHKDLSPI
jgi:hypothetical protein